LTGSAAYLDADRWQAIFTDDAKPPLAPGPPAAPVPPAPPRINAINLDVGVLDIAVKRMNEVKARMVAGAGAGGASAWTGRVNAKELTVEVTWRPEGRGKVQARLKHFTLPEDRPTTGGPASPARDLPELDIVAEDFSLRERRLGRLELMASNEVRDW